MYRSPLKHALRTLALASTLFVSLNVSASITPEPEAEACPLFSREQIDILKQSYALGEPHDLGYTLAAIAFKESSAGLYLINAMSSDYGVYQGNVKTVCKQAGVYHNDWQCNREIQKVVEDINVAAEHAIETLKYWRGYHGKRAKNYIVYENTIRSYNGGFGFKNVDQYWEEYRAGFHTIKRCVDFSA